MYESLFDPTHHTAVPGSSPTTPPSFVDENRLVPWKKAADFLNKRMRVSLIAAFSMKDDAWLCTLVDERGREVLGESTLSGGLDRAVETFMYTNAHLIRCPQGARTAYLLDELEGRLRSVETTLQTLRRVSNMAFTPEIQELGDALHTLSRLKSTYCVDPADRLKFPLFPNESSQEFSFSKDFEMAWANLYNPGTGLDQVVAPSSPDFDVSSTDS